jgi:hypothetical protein
MAIGERSEEIAVATLLVRNAQRLVAMDAGWRLIAARHNPLSRAPVAG